MQLAWKTALNFMFESPVFKRAWYWAGILLLLFPHLGWVIALGYLILVLRHLLNSGDVLQISLPQEWQKCFRSGLGAVAVIFCYFIPFMTLYWTLAAIRHDLSAHMFEIITFFALVYLFIPLFLPSLPMFYALYFPWLGFSNEESLILASLFFLTTFLMPAVFMQVSLKGSYWGALRIKDAAVTILKFPRQYLEAWGVSLLLISASFIILPLFPWITFWAYLAIGMLFNNVLAFDNNPEVVKRLSLVRNRYAADPR